MSTVVGQPRIAVPPLVDPAPVLDAAERARYARHLTLPGVGELGQRRIRAARVLVIGAGGLGSPILHYLCAAGVGALTVIDDDRVEASNLQRQVVHRHEDIARSKAHSAAAALRRLDPAITVRALEGRLSPDNALELFASHDLVIDGTDNFATRYLSNDAAELTGTPLVWGTIHQFSGQVSVFWPAHGPTLRDLFPDIPDADSVPSCAEGGVFGVLAGVVGSAMATEALKLVCGIGDPLVGRLWRYDALRAESSELAFDRDPDRVPVHDLGEVAVACAAAAPPHDTGAEVDSRRAWEMVERAEAVIVDVRQPWELDIARIPSAHAVPLRLIEEEGADALRHLPADKAVILVCKAGSRSLRAQRVLREHSARPVFSLAGGIVDWQQQIHGETLTY